MTALDFSARRRPRLQLPAGSCDAHCHVFGPGAVFPYAPGRRYTPDDAPREALAALHAHLGIDRAVIVQASCHGADNRAMLAAIASSPERTRGVAIVDDSFGERELLALHEGGVRGVRFNFIRHLGGHPDHDVFHRVMDRIREFGWHVVLHLGGEDIVPASDLIRALRVSFVIDHMGRIDSAKDVEQPAFRVLLDLLRIETGWVKLSGAERIALPPYKDALPFARALIAACPDRVLWGTDFPHPNPTHAADEAELVDLIPSFATDDDLRQRLLVANPARLYGFPV